MFREKFQLFLLKKKSLKVQSQRRTGKFCVCGKVVFCFEIVDRFVVCVSMYQIQIFKSQLSKWTTTKYSIVENVKLIHLSCPH